MNKELPNPKITITVIPDKDIDQECNDILTATRIVCQFLRLLRERGNVRSVCSLDYIHPGFNTCDGEEFFATIHYSVPTESFKTQQIKIFVSWYSKRGELDVAYAEQKTHRIKKILQDRTKKATEWLPLALIEAVAIGAEDLVSSLGKESVKLTEEASRIQAS